MSIIPWPIYRLVPVAALPGDYFRVFSFGRYLGSIVRQAPGQPWTAIRELKPVGESTTRGGAAALLRPEKGDWRPAIWSTLCAHCGCQAGLHRSDNGKCPPLAAPGLPLPPDLPPLDWKDVAAMEAWTKEADRYWDISTTFYLPATN